jgi:ribosomal protein S18 acetylase RimI-like enzyme
MGVRRFDKAIMTDTGLIVKHSLSDDDIVQIRALAAACECQDGIQVKFNWEQMRESGAASPRDFCWDVDGRVAGYAQIDGDGAEAELTGAVLPAFRRRGMFRRLFEAARASAQHRQAGQLLLVSYPYCPIGTEVARRLGTSYGFSEYHMEAEATAVPPLAHSELRLEEITPDDVSELSRTIGLSLGGGRWCEPDALREALQKAGERFFLAKIDRETVGQIGVVVPLNGDVYLRAVGILPERRRQGLGRQMLATTVHRLMAEGHRRFTLDVETDNAQALTLYHACGFRQTMVYDYSHVP